MACQGTAASAAPSAANAIACVEGEGPVPESADRNIAIGDLLALLAGQDAGLAGTGPEPG